ncbi:NAD(P)/FAD-dependent oxidoreductase [Rugosimonospora africana]|uniref:FAD-dependent oxidoreductase n=1 Tax=Rugosimonospora africana TaxID=556532 RepID=A0A8J3QSE6_9ACTN|nr:FAD-dependent monooxygenase [Rugosimonospora africana]GIH14768.1 FAD-dependent oxidoreductase [Rugosimonospora africana]
MAYDVIVVGARVAGAATALLLARRGVRVLTVDRARFPSDTLSTHQVQVPGVARLRRWGLLGELDAAGTPATREVRMDFEGIVLSGRFPPYDGADALYSPRRTVLDTVLVRAAREAGAEIREGFAAEELVWSRDRVVGIAGRQRGGARCTETAGLVVGADGKRSLVASAVGARRYRERPIATMACYTYWHGVPMAAGELYLRPGRAVAAFPTNDGLTMVYVAAPIAEFARFRTAVEEHYLASLDRCGDLGMWVRAGRRAERLRTTPDLPQLFRVPYGPGWALVGDAGVVMDPVSAQGIGNALRDAELLADAITSAMARGRPPDAHLAGYHRRRDAAVRPMYDFTAGLAALDPLRRAQRYLLAALRDRPAEADRFLGAFAGVTPIRQYRSPRTALRLLGVRGLAGLAVAAAGGRLG